jgi:CTP-dependent riboflavin kinase
LDSICESNWKKITGKPYSGKLNVRFDEGELEIERLRHYASSLLYCKPLKNRQYILKKTNVPT